MSSEDFSGDNTLPVPDTGPIAGDTPTVRLGKPDTVAATLAPSSAKRYTLGALLGQGGMGEVVLAFDEHIGREVAVKRIRSAVPSGEELSRFLREARVQGRLQHPAIVPVHDLAYDGSGKPYFVMKRLTGTTMSELLDQLRTAADDEPTLRRRLLRAFADICLAVELAHTQGIVHRDLKPANVMLGDFGEVYVLDWGVARAVTDEEPPLEAHDSGSKPPSGLELDSGETRAGTVLGTPAYMAPEQLTGDRAGPAADIYALGCILYEIATARVLHLGRRSVTNLLKPLDAKPSSVRADSPPELDAICVRATKLDPAERFTSARALGDAVQAFLDGDRDVAVRRELAELHVATARTALARGRDDEDARRTAIQAAGRALALDPTSREAAELVSSLVLEPPPQVPTEVVRDMEVKETQSARSQGRLAAVSQIGYLAFIPLMLWSGVRQPWVIALFGALAVGSALQVLALTRSTSISQPRIYLSAAINAVLIAVVCRIVGPFIIAPTLVTTTLMAYAAHPGFGRIRIVATILGAGLAIPWLLEATGVIGRTYEFTGGELHLFSPTLAFSSIPVQLAFALLLLALVGVVALLTRVLAIRQREAAMQLEVQAWHLRQILPTAPR